MGHRLYFSNNIVILNIQNNFIYVNSADPDEIPRYAIETAPANSVESDHGCTSRIYFDNEGDNVTLMSKKPC